MSVKSDIIEMIERLPEERLETVRQYLNQLQPAEEPREESSSGWDDFFALIDDIVQNIPPEELERLPHDGAENHDHYLYGSPKK